MRGALAMQLHDDVRVRTRFMLAPGNERYLLLDVSQFESDPGKLNSTAAMLRVWQHLAAAAYSSPRSSNANSLCGAFSADSPKIEATTRPDFAPDAFRSSSPPSRHVRLELGNVEFSGGKFCRGSGIATGWLAAQTRMVSVVGFAP